MNSPEKIKIPARSKVIFEHLKLCAFQMRTVTYEEIADQFNLAKLGVGHQLNYIRDEICRKQGLPWLNALVVNKKTNRPGDKFIPNDANLTEKDQELFWRGMVMQVFSFDWSKVNFTE
jgi:hypothetical protein